jgi:hypothetical protein
VGFYSAEKLEYPHILVDGSKEVSDIYQMVREVFKIKV